MQHGDLETWTGHRIFVVLEGVLATVVPVVETHRWRKDEVTGWNLIWHDIPLKRIVYMTDRFPDLAFEIVTFLPQEVADLAAEWLNDIPIPYSAIEAVDYRQFCSRLKFRQDIQQIIDSDPERLHNYGQLGKQVVMGGDF
jgi:hypothetical protein